MMGGVLARVLDMSWTAGVVIVLVLAVRAVLRRGRAPRRVICLLWLVVIFRLLCPVTLESAYSLLPVNSRPVSEGMAQTTVVSVPDMASAEATWEPAAKAEGADRQLTWLDRAAWLWLAGVAVMAAHALWSFRRLERQLTLAVPEGGRLYRLRGPAAPFVLGLIRPWIYLPDDLTETEERYILLHERMHIRRGDHVVKAASFAALCLHWFNPLVWLAFFALERDMEMACDEAVLVRLGDGVKKAYSASLLRLAAGRQSLGAVPLAFGENDTKSHVRHVLSYRKPLGWVAALLLLLAALAAVGLALDPPADELVVAEGEMALSDGRTARVQLVLEDAQVLAGEEVALGGGWGERNYTGRASLVVWIGERRVSRLPLDGRAGFDQQWVFNIKRFTLWSDDYNDDGDPDFALGQWGSSSAQVYTLFSLDERGRVYLLSEPEGIASSDGDMAYRQYSQRFDHEHGLITTRVYNNALGRYLTATYAVSPADGLFRRKPTEAEPPFYLMIARGENLERIWAYGSAPEQDNEVEQLLMAEEEAVDSQGIFRFTKEMPELMAMRLISADGRQAPYPLEDDYRFLLPANLGHYRFCAELAWADGREEAVYFGLIVARYDEGLIQSVTPTEGGQTVTITPWDYGSSGFTTMTLQVDEATGVYAMGEAATVEALGEGALVLIYYLPDDDWSQQYPTGRALSLVWTMG